MYNTDRHWISHVLSWVVFFYTGYSEDSIPQSTDATWKEEEKRFHDQLSLGNPGLNKTGELIFLYDFMDPLIS